MPVLRGGSGGREELPVASPGFVARRGKARDYVMRNSRRASGPGAADCSVTNSFVSAIPGDTAVCAAIHRTKNKSAHSRCCDSASACQCSE